MLGAGSIGGSAAEALSVPGARKKRKAELPPAQAAGAPSQSVASAGVAPNAMGTAAAALGVEAPAPVMQPSASEFNQAIDSLNLGIFGGSKRKLLNRAFRK